MTNYEPEMKVFGTMPVQLCFFYDPVTRQIPFSSTPLDSFFGTALHFELDPPFLGAFNETNGGGLLTEWRSWIQDKDKEPKHFSLAGTYQETPVIFSFTVIRPVSSLLTDSDLMIITVARTVSTFLSPEPERDNISSPFQKEYAEFIELAVHDLDSPLRKLSMLIDRITCKYENITDSDTQGYIMRSRACLSDMRGLIEDLSVLGRLNSSTIKKIPCDLEDIIRAVLKDLGEANHVAMPKDPMPVVEGDIVQYKQLFRNLLANAFKFQKKDTHLEVEIFSEAVTDDEKKLHNLPVTKSYFKITISDNGIGFSQANAEKIFQPFVRLNGKSEFTGSGIGLAICKKIVENHRGILYAESDGNLGSRFILLLPLSPY